MNKGNTRPRKRKGSVPPQGACPFRRDSRSGILVWAGGPEDGQVFFGGRFLAGLVREGKNSRAALSMDSAIQLSMSVRKVL